MLKISVSSFQEMYMPRVKAVCLVILYFYSIGEVVHVRISFRNIDL